MAHSPASSCSPQRSPASHSLVCGARGRHSGEPARLHLPARPVSAAQAGDPRLGLGSLRGQRCQRRDAGARRRRGGAAAAAPAPPQERETVRTHRPATDAANGDQSAQIAEPGAESDSWVTATALAEPRGAAAGHVAAPAHDRRGHYGSANGVPAPVRAPRRAARRRRDGDAAAQKAVAPRCSILVLAVVGLVAAGWTQGSEASGGSRQARGHWFAPYEDVTLTPTYHFEDSREPGARPGAGLRCRQTQAAAARRPGARTTTSTGPPARSTSTAASPGCASAGGTSSSRSAGPPTASCGELHRQSELTPRTPVVVQRYNARTLDFDIEGTALDDAPRSRGERSRSRRSSARPGSRAPVTVWLTLPVTPQGLPPRPPLLVSATLQGGAKLAGVNIMTMDYGGSKPAGSPCELPTSSRCAATFRQLDATLPARRTAIAPAINSGPCSAPRP